MNKFVSIVSGISVVALAVAVSLTDKPTRPVSASAIQTDSVTYKPIHDAGITNSAQTVLPESESLTLPLSGFEREIQHRNSLQSNQKQSVSKPDQQVEPTNRMEEQSNDNASAIVNNTIGPSVFKNPEQDALPADIQAFLDQEAQQQEYNPDAYPLEFADSQQTLAVDPVKQAQLQEKRQKIYQEFKEEVKYYDFNERFNLSRFMEDERLYQLDAQQGNELIEYVFKNLQGIALLENQPAASE
ncbi:MAG: hypothetical protein OEZ68_15285 [Gammaproteobacteria bacterium]|nr:hypothetical protein [Gammaproteobacteria bacterium]MDH5802164.1 hypothetical protein [Gammaproteobacteria bacterium]